MSLLLCVYYIVLNLVDLVFLTCAVWRILYR